jgi:hypothetical protein
MLTPGVGVESRPISRSRAAEKPLPESVGFDERRAARIRKDGARPRTRCTTAQVSSRHPLLRHETGLGSFPSARAPAAARDRAGLPMKIPYDRAAITRGSTPIAPTTSWPATSARSSTAAGTVGISDVGAGRVAVAVWSWAQYLGEEAAERGRRLSPPGA